MRRDPEFFGEAELPLLYVARRLSDALRLEGILAEANIDFLVETGVYAAGFLLRRNLTGAFFYVSAAQLETARQVLQRNRYKPILSDPQP